MKKVFMLFAEGFETVEAVMVVDLLRRGGVEVTMTSINEEEQVKSAQGVTVQMDETLGEIDLLSYDGVILPGGMPGTIHLAESEAVKKAILAMNEAGKIVSAICAAPSVLGKYGLLEGKKACSYPDHECKLTGAAVEKNPVSVDGNIITSQGLGTAMEFGFALLGALEGAEKVQQIKDAIIYQELA
ncbi:MAG: DJ-1/PfpI family protein [Ruminococcus sp.]|nr:DJ-1/PfpI family protein [Ruminococcus sp.]